MDRALESPADRRKGRRLRRTTLTLLFTAGLVPTTLHAETPQGRVLEPRLGALDMPADRIKSIDFKGWVDFSGSQGHIEIIVLTQGNADSSDPFLWREFVRVFPSRTPTVVNGQNRYSWEIILFASDMFPGAGWPDGGTARARFRAVRDDDGSSTYLPVRDGSGAAGHVVDLVLADKAPSPADLPPDLSPNYLNRKPTLSQDETGKYYLSVGTGANGERPTILESLFTVGSFKQRYFDDAASCPTSTPEFVAKYFNKGDLGLGREMHCVYNGCTKETACYFKNYGTRDGTPRFNDRAEAKRALLADKPFATVAMVERGAMAVGAPNKVFFVVYDHQHLLDPDDPDSAPVSLEAQLDNKGFNKSIPANCMVCHGAASRYEPNTAPSFPFNSKVTGAYFLPFDLEAFEFFRSLTTDPLSRAQQEAAFKGMNQIVYFTDLWFNFDANQLIKGWYGGPGFLSPTFQGRFVPTGWRNADDAVDNINRRQLYRNVVARSCRTCHISHASDPFTSGLTFGTYDQFSTSAALAYLDVCGTHQMPNAEQSLKVFWRGSGRPQLLNRLALPKGCAVESGTAAVATHSPASAVSGSPLLELLRLYETESCGCATVRCLQEVEDRFLDPFAATRADPRQERELQPLLRSAMDCRLRILGEASAASGQSAADRLAERQRERKSLSLGPPR
jgi:hypothetical protein